MVPSSCLNLETPPVTPHPRMQSNSTKILRFSAVNEIKYVVYPTDEKHEKWYDQEDVGKFHFIFARDINRCSRMLITKSDRGLKLSEEERNLCIGIVHLLSRDVSKNIKLLNAMKESHLYAVLIEQARQRHFHINSVEELGQVSRKSSHCSRQRSHMIATLSMPELS